MVPTPTHLPEKKGKTEYQQPSFVGIASKTGTDITDTVVQGCEVRPKDLIDPHLIKDIKKILPKLIAQASEREKQLKNTYIQNCQGQYASLLEKRQAKGKELPALETIIDNFMCLSDTRRAQEATDLVRKKFSADHHIQALYQKDLEGWKTCILDVHRIMRDNNLQPFELAQRPDLMRQGIQQMQEYLQQHGVSASQTKQIYELLADYGYLGTAEETEKVREKVEKLEELLNIGRDFEDYLYQVFMGGGVVGGFLGAGISGLTSIFFYNKTWPSSGVLVAIGTLSIISCYFLMAQLFEEVDSARSLVAYPVNKPRHMYWKKKLDALEQRHDKIKAIQTLVKNLDNLSMDYENVDTMSDTQIATLLERLTNISVLQTYLAKRGETYTFEQLDELSSKNLAGYTAKIHDYEQKKVDDSITKMTQTLLEGGYAKKDIDEIIIKTKQMIADKYAIKLPSDIIEIPSNKSTFEIIEDIDEQVERLGLTEEQREIYETMQAKVLADEASIDDLLKTIGEIMQAHPSNYESIKQEMKKLLEQIDITSETNPTLFRDLLDAVLEKHPDHAISKTSGALGSEKDTDVLDLDDLKKALATRTKQKEPVLVGKKK